MSADIQLELTENVKKQKNTLIKTMKAAAAVYHSSSDKPVFQDEGGKKRLSLQTSAEAQNFKRAKGDKPHTPGLQSHVDSSKGYPSLRTTVSPTPYQGNWNEQYPEHLNLGKGKSGKKGSKGKGKGKSKGKGSGKGKQTYQQPTSGAWWQY